MKRMTAVVSMLVLTSTLLFGCGSNSGEQQETDTPQTTQETQQETDGQQETDTEVSEEAEQPQEPALADGIYTAEFHTDSSMFHVNETCDGKGTLTVKDGGSKIGRAS